MGVFTWLLSSPPTSVDTNVLTTNEVHAFIIALVAAVAAQNLPLPYAAAAAMPCHPDRLQHNDQV